jgi:phage N-6-adenine-methyltransferase
MKSRRCIRCRNPLPPQQTGRPRQFCSGKCKKALYRRRSKQKVYHSSRSDDWATPPDLFALLDAEFGFTLDVCASASNAKCPAYFREEDDGLAQPWTGRVFMNPPYGRSGGDGRTIDDWMRKAWESVQGGTAEIVVCLVRASTDTHWWA